MRRPWPTGALSRQKQTNKIFEYVLLFLDSVAKFRKATVSFVISVFPSAWNISAPTDFSLNLIFDGFFHKSIDKIQVSFKRDKNRVLHVNMYVHFDTIICRLILLRIVNISEEKSCVESQNMYSAGSKFFLRKSCRL